MTQSPRIDGEPSFPWKRILTLALCDLHVKPETFWRMTLAELNTMLALKRSVHMGDAPMSRAELDALRRQHPDDY